MTHGRISQFWSWEPLLFFGEKLKTKRANDVFNFPIGMQKEAKGHPTPKPLKLWGELITHWTEKGDIVFDPFSGSGTTLMACEQLNRISYGLEIEPKYCQLIINRFERYCIEHKKKFDCKINGKPYAKEA
jgi:DNA modification methylase